ncbi:hypothetical protein [Maribacter sp. 2210JD10-5]|uniref:hypothetical protein n=1 Tax=Maribacter sp. 2210JD10-5 TaxID=3386272 RepID=UPI0039BD5582
MKNFWNIFLISTAALSVGIFLSVRYFTKNKIESITYDSKIDKTELNLCDKDQIGQYYMFSTDYNGGKKAIKNILLPKIRKDELSFGKKSGTITIRFIVNCKGETGIFRVKAINKKLIATDFDNAKTEHLISLVKELKNWTVETKNGKKYDSYYFINFKITNGLVSDIF